MATERDPDFSPEYLAALGLAHELRAAAGEPARVFVERAWALLDGLRPGDFNDQERRGRLRLAELAMFVEEAFLQARTLPGPTRPGPRLVG